MGRYVYVYVNRQVCVCEEQAGVYVCELGRGVCMCVKWSGVCMCEIGRCVCM